MNRRPLRKPGPPGGQQKQQNYWGHYPIYRPWPPYYGDYYWNYWDHDYDYDWGDYYLDESINDRATLAFNAGVKKGKQQVLRAMGLAEENPMPPGAKPWPPGYAPAPAPMPSPINPDRVTNPVAPETAGYCGSVGG